MSELNASYRLGMNISFNSEDIPCNLLPSSNASYSFATNWENIPETFLLNGIIASILFIIFIYLTRIAWRTNDNEEENAKPSLVTLLYGYRDPERWYVIPRFEFLRKSKKRHQHDLTSTCIYVPPKLPLANPIELFNYYNANESVDSNENISNDRIKKSLKETEVSDQKATKAIKSKESTVVRFTNLTKESSKFDERDALKSLKSSKSPTIFDREVDTNNSTLEHFFYPSILTAEQLQASYISRKLNQFFGLFFKVTDADIIFAKGIDAYEYLLFQRHLILIMILTNLLCLCIILPIHWHANKETSPLHATSFQRTTIKNMRPSSTFYWTHLICSIIVVIFSMIVFNSYRESTISKEDAQLARRTLLIGNIPAEQRNRVKLTRVFQEYFSDSSIEAIQFVYDTSKLENYYKLLAVDIVAKEYCLYQRRHNKKDILVKPTGVNEAGYCNGLCRLCSLCLVCCCYWPREEKQVGATFYTYHEQHLRDEISKTFVNLEPSEYAFVTFKSHRDAKRVMKKLANLKAIALEEKHSKIFGRNFTKGSKSPSKSLESVETAKIIAGVASQNKKIVLTHSNETSDPLDPKNNPHIRSIRSPINKIASVPKKKEKEKERKKKLVESVENGLSLNSSGIVGPVIWSGRYAPHPDNVEYADLLHLTTTSRYTVALLYLAMVVIFIFVTTPSAVLSTFERWKIIKRRAEADDTFYEALVTSYFAVLVQLITTNLLPYLISLIAQQIPYEDTASKNHSMMWKIYLFLVLMVIIMPSIGMTSAPSFISQNIDIKCLFPADNGAYYINYVVSTMFLSTMLELIKPMDIISYYFILWTGRSRADYEAARQCIIREFSVGMQHTSVLLIFSAVMTYSISCPLIAPAGLLYLLVKHAVDHYQLFYTYFTKKVDKNLQDTIITFARCALLMMLFQTTVAIIINTGPTSYFSFCSEIIFLITLIVFSFSCFADCTSRPLKGLKRSRYQRDFCACFYLPRVIENLFKLKAIPESCISRKI